MTITTYDASSGHDGPAMGGGTYVLRVTEDILNAGQPNERRTLLHVVIDGTNRPALATNYQLIAGTSVNIDSSRKPGDPGYDANFPPCPAGQSLRLPATGEFNVRIDNVDYQWSIG